MPVERVSTFVAPDEYSRQATEARRRRRMAEILAQQAYQPTDVSAPIPAAAPLVQGLQAYLTARQARKADEAEEAAGAAATRAGEQVSNYLFGGGRIPKTAADLTEVAPAGKLQPQTAADLTEVTPEGAYIKPYEKDPAAALRLAMTPAGTAAMKGNPMLAAALAQSMERPKGLQVGAIDPSRFTPQSIAAAMKSGDPSQLQPVAEPAKPPTVAGGMMWNAEQGGFVPIPGYAEQQGQIAASKRPDVVVMGNRGGGMGKPPTGYRYTAEGDLEAIPGGPADPSRERVMPGSITQNVVEERARGRKFADISSRADEFISAIKKGELPLSPVSSAKYQAQRMFDSSRGVQPNEKEPYVRFFDLQRFVNEQVNAILNLAKGPQTEGDALRARQQILDNFNNEKVVVSALKNLQRIYNKEAELSEQTAADYENQYGRGNAPAASPASPTLPPGFRKVK
jgi:hypothetical protein